MRGFPPPPPPGCLVNAKRLGEDLSLRSDPRVGLLDGPFGWGVAETSSALLESQKLRGTLTDEVLSGGGGEMHVPLSFLRSFGYSARGVSNDVTREHGSSPLGKCTSCLYPSSSPSGQLKTHG